MAMEIAKEIGIAAVLEQLAEECAELGHAALKLARITRGENPTPVSKKLALEMLHEEGNDVLLCLEELIEYGALSKDETLQTYKRYRWIDRIKESRGVWNESENAKMG